MPYPSKGARLYYRKKRRVWIIRDGEVEIGTSCRLTERAKAEEKLAQYLASKFTPDTAQRNPAKIPVAEVLNNYAMAVAPNKACPN